MTTATTVAIDRPSIPESPTPTASAARRYAFPGYTFVMTLSLLALVGIPYIWANTRLVWSIAGVGGVLLVWQLGLWARARQAGRAFVIEFRPVKAHYVQACVQLGILTWWGIFAAHSLGGGSPGLLKAVPLILAQVLFLYVLDAVLSWTRGWNWRFGFGPLPIIFSTNLLLWFKDDWFFLQFLMVALGAFGKQFILWRRAEGKRHIFNPSVFGQSLIALGLIYFGLTNDLTWGREIASSFETPHMLIVIFVLGLVVEYQFHVTLMTLSAAIVLILTNLIYHSATGVYYFVNINLAAPIFLGIHLLITDPSTSPRTNTGRIIFGGLYGLGYVALFRIFDSYEVPLFWDKLLPVPILNLMVPLLDRFAKSGVIGRLNHRWETALRPRPMNLVHMGLWSAIFVSLFATGFIDAPHEGNSIEFWKKAVAERKPHAGNSLVMAAGALAEGGGVPSAYNELGLISMEGEFVNQNAVNAARFFSKACEMGDLNGCANVAIRYLFQYQRRSDEDVARALDTLENACDDGTWPGGCYFVGNAYETGRMRPLDPQRAIECYERGGDLFSRKGIARIALTDNGVNYDLQQIAAVLNAPDVIDEECCWYLGYMFHQGNGAPRDDSWARHYLKKACELGLTEACNALRQPMLPPFENPTMIVPSWSSAYPVPNDPK